MSRLPRGNKWKSLRTNPRLGSQDFYPHISYPVSGQCPGDLESPHFQAPLCFLAKLAPLAPEKAQSWELPPAAIGEWWMAREVCLEKDSALCPMDGVFLSSISASLFQMQIPGPSSATGNL